MVGFGGNIPQDKIDAARKQRNDNKITPSFRPGQGPTGGNSMNNAPGSSPFGQKPASPFGDGSGAPQQSSSPFGASQSSSPFSAQQQSAPPFGAPQQIAPPFGAPQQRPGGFGNGFGAQQQPQQQQPQTQKTSEEKLETAVTAGATGIFAFFKELASSFKQVDARHMRESSNRVFVSSIALGILTAVLGIFKHNIWFLTGAYAITIPSAMLFSYFMKKYDTEDEQEPEPEPMQQQPFPEPVPQFEPEPEPNPVDLFADDDEDDEDDEDEDWDDEDEDEDDEEDEDTTPMWQKAIKPEPENGDPEAALAEVDDMDKNMISRQFLYESSLKAMQSITPDYRDENKIDEDSNKFDEMNAIVNDMFSVMGFEDEDIPDLQEYSESLFVDRLVIDRPQKKFKEADFDNEFTRVLKKGYAGSGGNPNMYSHTETVGRTIITQIFKGASPMVTVADVMKANKDFYLNQDKEAPTIIGIDEEGKEVKFDFLDADDVLMTGKKRSGKSYTIRSLLTQLLIFNGPEKVNFYIGDTKGAASDFYRFRVPHVKQFESNPTEILKMLEFIVNKESRRREKLFKEAGVIKISDYHTVRPDADDMPYLYVIIDEMVTLSTKLKAMKTKDVDYLSIYYGYINSLVTMLPAYGIRLIAVPHRITNDILPKTASDNMTFKTTVRADESLLKETLDITQKKFGFNTPNPGDLAIKLNLVKAEPFYAKSIVPASTPEISDQIFDFQRKLWSKLRPESVADSQYAKEHPEALNNGKPTDFATGKELTEDNSISAEDFTSTDSDANKETSPFDSLF